LKGRNPIPPNSAKRPKLLIVNEAPNKEEERKCETLSNHDGRKFKEMLHKLGVHTEKVGYINAIACRPFPSMPQKQWKTIRENCYPRLVAEVAEIDPAVVVPAGKVPLQSIRHAHKVDDHAGFLEKTHEDFGSRRCISTHLIREAMSFKPEVKPVVQMHVKRAWDWAMDTLEPIEWPKTILNEAAAKLYLQSLIKEEKPLFVGVDVETIGDGYDPDLVLRCFGLATKDFTISLEYPIQDPECDALMKQALGGHHIYCFHNGLHDVPVLRRFGYPCENRFDTMAAHAILAPTLRHTLAYALGMEFPAPNWKFLFHSLKTIRDKKGVEAFAKAPMAELLVYNSRDSYLTAILAERLHARLMVRENGMELFSEQMNLTYEIGYRMTERGVAVNTPAVLEHEVICIQKIAESIKPLQDIALRYGFEDFNPRSPKQLHSLYFGTWKVKPTKYSKDTRQPSLDVEAVQPYLTHEHEGVREFSRALLVHRKWEKKLGTYVRKMKDKDIVRGSWKSFGTVTGRWSSSGPNMQNIDRELHNMFRARDGYQLVEVDYSQLELKVVAWLAGDYEALEAFKHGADGHTMTAQGIFQCSAEEVTKEQRKLAKAFNFGTNYGATEETIWENLVVDYPQLTLEHIYKLMDDFKKARPKLEAFRQHTLRHAQKYKYLELPISGRRIYFHGEVKPTETANYPIQGTAGDIVNKSIQDLDVVFRAPQFDETRIIMQIHDAIIVETKEPELVVPMMRKIMQQPFELDGIPFSFSVDADVGIIWGDLKEVK
jgi:uracil-DNA glycosylase family 4